MHILFLLLNLYVFGALCFATEFHFDEISRCDEILKILKKNSESGIQTSVVLDLDETALTPHSHRNVLPSPFSYTQFQLMQKLAAKVVICTQREEKNEKEKTHEQVKELGLKDPDILMATDSFKDKGSRLKSYFEKSKCTDVIFVDDLVENLESVYGALKETHKLHLLHFNFNAKSFPFGETDSYIFPARELARASKNTDGAGILIWTMKEGKPHVLLGHRDDEDTWCNMGGKADDEDQFFHVTAAREVREESMGLYAFTPEQVKGFSSHDLFMPEKSIIYRMYIAQGGLIPDAELNRKLKDSKGHSAEYTMFKWIPLSNLLSAIKNPKGTELKVDLGDDASITIMQEVARMLWTKPIQDLLENLEKPKIPLHTWSAFDSGKNPKEAPFGVKEEGSLRSWFHFSSPGIVIFDEYISPIYGLSNLIELVISDQLRSLGDPVSLSEGSEKVQGEPALKHLTEEERKAVLLATSARFDRWGTHPLSPTQAYMKLILGAEYVEGSTRLILEQNLRTFIGKLRSEDRELKRPIEVDDEGIKKLVDAFEFELGEYTKKQVTLYHSLKGELFFLYKYITELCSLLKGQSMDEYGMQRGVSTSFINPLTKKPYINILDVLDKFGEGDYGKERSTLLLCVNPILALGPGSLSHSTSSCIEYFFNSHSVEAPPIKKLLMELLLLQGMSPDQALQCYEEFYSLFLQFFQSNLDKPNGGLLAFSVPQEQVVTHTLAVHGGGRPHLPSPKTDTSLNPSVMQMLLNVQERASGMDVTRGNFWALGFEEKEKIKNVTNEARLYLDPSKYFKVRGFWHYDLDSQQNKLFQQSWNPMMRAHLSRLLGARSRPFENALYLPDPKRSLMHRFQVMHKKQYGNELELLPPANVLPILIEKGMIEAIKDYLVMFPGALDPEDPKGEIKKALVHALFSNNCYELIPVLGEYKLNVSELFSSKEKQMLAFFSNFSDFSPLDFQEFLKFIGDDFSEELQDEVTQNIMDRIETRDGFDSKNSKLKTALKELKINVAKQFDKFFEGLVSSKKFTGNANAQLLRFIELGFSFDPNDEKGLINFNRLLDAVPNDLRSRDFFNWDFLIGGLVDKHKINVYKAVSNKGVPLFFRMKSLNRYWSTYKQDIDIESKLTTSDGRNLDSYCRDQFLDGKGFLTSSTDLSNSYDFSSLDTKLRPYGLLLTSDFRYSKWTGNPSITIKEEAYDLWLKRLETALDSKEWATSIESVIDELDDLNVLFLNHHRVDAILKTKLSKKPINQTPFVFSPLGENIASEFQLFAQSYGEDDVSLFTNGLLLRHLKRNDGAYEKMISALKSKKQTDVLDLTRKLPLSVVVKFLNIFSGGTEGRNDTYPDAMLEAVKRVAEFRIDFFKQYYRGIYEISSNFGESISDCFIPFCSHIYEFDQGNRNIFFKKLFEISGMQSLVMNDEKALRELGTLRDVGGQLSIMQAFDDPLQLIQKVVLEGEENNDTFFSSSEFIYEASKLHIEGYDKFVSEFLKKRTHVKSLTYKDIVDWIGSLRPDDKEVRFFMGIIKNSQDQ